MLLIDFAKLNAGCLGTTLADRGMTDLNHLSFPTILEKLQLGSNRDPTEYFPTTPPNDRIDFSSKLIALKQQKAILDIIGPAKIAANIPVCFTTFVALRPKTYLRQYVEVARVLCGDANQLRFNVWLEDILPRHKNSWSESTTQQAVDAFKAFFAQEFPAGQIMLSSQIAPAGIPKWFAENLTTITTEDFLSALPFHLRNPMFIKTFQVVHFTWNCYLLHRWPGVYLGGINNKRHFQIFRKVAGTNVTVILLPLGTESVLP